jgi:hypothetical protein
MNKYVLTLFIVVFSLSFCIAEKVINVENIEGEAFIEGNISPNEAKKLALNDAKINALKKAGIAENVKSYQLLFTSQTNNDFNQFFNSDIQTEIQGAVKEYQIISEKVYCDGDFKIIYKIIINAQVIKYETKEDVSFDFYVDGLKSLYNNDEKLLYTIKSSKDGYLTVFNITDTESSILFPNIYEKNSFIVSDSIRKIPKTGINIRVHTDLKNGETNRLIYVFTKSKIPFIKMNSDQVTSQEYIFNWIYSIPPDQRKVEYKAFYINK